MCNHYAGHYGNFFATGRIFRQGRINISSCLLLPEGSQELPTDELPHFLVSTHASCPQCQRVSRILPHWELGGLVHAMILRFAKNRSNQTIPATDPPPKLLEVPILLFLNPQQAFTAFTPRLNNQAIKSSRVLPAGVFATKDVEEEGRSPFPLRGYHLSLYS